MAALQPDSLYHNQANNVLRFYHPEESKIVPQEVLQNSKDQYIKYCYEVDLQIWNFMLWRRVGRIFMTRKIPLFLSTGI